MCYSNIIYLKKIEISIQNRSKLHNFSSKSLIILPIQQEISEGDHNVNKIISVLHCWNRPGQNKVFHKFKKNKSGILTHRWDLPTSK